MIYTTLTKAKEKQMNGIDEEIVKILSDKHDIHDIDIREIAEQIGRQIVKILIEAGVLSSN